MNLRRKLAFAVMALAIPSSWADIPESSVSSAAVFAVKKAWPRAGFIEARRRVSKSLCWYSQQAL